MSDSVTTPTEPRTDRTSASWPDYSTLRYDREHRTLLIDGTDGLPISVAEYVLPGFADHLLASQPEPASAEPQGSVTAVTEALRQNVLDAARELHDSQQVSGSTLPPGDRGIGGQMMTGWVRAERVEALLDATSEWLAAVPAPSPAPAVSCTVHNLNPCPICAKSVYFGTDTPAAEPSTEGYQLPTTPTGLWLSNLAPELWKQAPRGELMEPMQIPIRRAILAIEAEARAASPSPAVAPGEASR